MPYIKEYQRELVMQCLSSDIVGIIPALTPGELNFLLTHIVHKYVTNKVLVNYALLNQVIGVLECVKASFVETVLLPYEREKMRENGPISGLDKGN